MPYVLSSGVRAPGTARRAHTPEREPAHAPREPDGALDVRDLDRPPGGPVEHRPVLDPPAVRRACRPAARRAPPRTRPPRARRWGSGAGRRRPARPVRRPAGRPPATAASTAVSRAPGPARDVVEPGRGPAVPAVAGATCGRPWRPACSRPGSRRSPGTPPTAPHTRAPTTASEVFSATDSTTARAIPSASSACGSRPHRCGSRARAAVDVAAPPGPARWPGPRGPAKCRRPPPRWRRRSARRRRRGDVRTARAATRGRARWRHRRTQRCAARPSRGGRATAPVPRQPAARPNAATGCPRRGSPSEQVAEKSGGGAVREDAIGTHRTQPTAVTDRRTGAGARCGSRAWRCVLTQGVHALVRRDRR